MLSERMRDRGVCTRLVICILSTVSCSPCFAGCVSTICPGLATGNVSNGDEDEITTEGSIDPPNESAYPNRQEYIKALQKWAKDQEAEHRSAHSRSRFSDDFSLLGKVRILMRFAFI